MEKKSPSTKQNNNRYKVIMELFSCVKGKKICFQTIMYADIEREARDECKFGHGEMVTLTMPNL